jgi:2-hydroxy-3-keto-5-methylthiopentenyl-1-phosphate phosphatase
MLGRPELHGRSGRETLVHRMEKNTTGDRLCEDCFSTSVSLGMIEKPRPMKLAVLSDFDGTVTLNDTFENVLARFGKGDWRTVDDQYVRGKITLEECVRRQGAMVQVSEPEILDYLNRVTEFRPNFDQLVEFRETNHFPPVIVSAGLDFVIKHFLTARSFKTRWN